MLKETSLVFENLHARADLFKQDFSFQIYIEESENNEPLYHVKLSHSSLGLTQTFRESIENIALFKSQLALNKWIENWNQLHQKEKSPDYIPVSNESPNDLLFSSLKTNHEIDFEKFKNNSPFESSASFNELKLKLESLETPAQPKPVYSPPMPVYKEPEIRFSQKLLFKQRGILRDYEAQYVKKLDNWRMICEKNEKLFAENISAYEQAMTLLEGERETIKQEIILAGQTYEQERLRKNEVTDIFQINYQSKEPEAVKKYFELVLHKSAYPEIFPKQSLLEYHKENHTLYISLELPHPDLLKQETETPSTAKDKKDDEINYDEIIYKLILKTFHELFSSDKAETLDAIHFMGWVRTLNRGNGQFENIPIVALFASREIFSGINLIEVDPKLCFHYLKGISGPVLSELRPIPVPFSINQGNSQEGSSKKILEPIDNNTNLANMVWHDFEKNIMDLFQKEFGGSKVDIKLIHSALETGLEAIAEDPDLLRGGKILFHAKRSIKPIPVSAIRELFGSVMHEAAIKGIIVTTADFTPEAYDFAKNKPLRLVNGSILLGMFEKQGKHMRINLREAVSLESWLS